MLNVLSLYVPRRAYTSMKIQWVYLIKLSFSAVVNVKERVIFFHKEQLHIIQNMENVSSLDFLNGSMNLNSRSYITSFPNNDLYLNGLSLNRMINSDFYLYSLDTFDSSTDLRTWSYQDVSTCGISADLFLGGACKLGLDNNVTRTFVGLPPHTYARITGRIHYIDRWQDDTMLIAIDDNLMYSNQHHWCPNSRFESICKRSSISQCGHPAVGDTLSKFFSISVRHTNSTLAVTLHAQGDGDKTRSGVPCAVSWGVDDVALYLK